MARKNRLAAPGLTDHVVNRGNDRKIVFRQNFDYIAFIELLAEARRKFEVFVYGYCLMPNHFHLLIEPRAHGALSAFMQRVTGRYACTLRQQTNTVDTATCSSVASGTPQFITTWRSFPCCVTSRPIPFARRWCQERVAAQARLHGPRLRARKICVVAADSLVERVGLGTERQGSRRPEKSESERETPERVPHVSVLLNGHLPPSNPGCRPEIPARNCGIL